MAAISAGTLLKEPRRSHLLVRSRRRPPPCSANTIRWARNEVGNAGERPARHRHWRAGGWKRCPRRCEGPSTWETHGRGAGGSSRTRIAVGTTRADLGAAGDRGSMSLGSTRSRCGLPSAGAAYLPNIYLATYSKQMRLVEPERAEPLALSRSAHQVRSAFPQLLQASSGSRGGGPSLERSRAEGCSSRTLDTYGVAWPCSPDPGQLAAWYLSRQDFEG